MIPPEAKYTPHSADGIDYRLLAENCADILCCVTRDNKIQYISPSCFEILGWKPMEMAARDLRQFILADDLPALEDLEVCEPPEGTAYTHARLRFLKKDRATVWISINARYVCESAMDEPRLYILSMRDITGRTVLEEKLSALAMTDGLTGLWNRSAFDQVLRREWRRSVREESQLSLLLLDLDHFKTLNDKYGHPLGDKCLVMVASAISDVVRASDVACRWGGDEIAIILPATDSGGALKAAEKVRIAIETVHLGLRPKTGELLSVTASIGAATAMTQPDGTTATTQNLLLAADKALYRAKHEGGNRISVAPLLVACGSVQTVGAAVVREAIRMGGSGGVPPNGIDGL